MENISQYYESLSYGQKLALFLNNTEQPDIIEYMLSRQFYIDDAFFLLPFISGNVYIKRSILQILIVRYMHCMQTILNTCPEFVSNNVFTLLKECIKYEQDDVISVIKSLDLSQIIKCDPTIRMLEEVGFKLE